MSTERDTTGTQQDTTDHSRGRSASAADWLFCDCGSMTRVTDDGTVRCTACGETLPESRDPEFVVTDTQTERSPRIAEDTEASFEHPTKQCPDCRARTVLNVIKQTRAADEPGTLFFRCANCGNQWRKHVR